MCGIVGVVGNNEQAGPLLLGALKRMEPRGYDSAGIVVITYDGDLSTRRASGKLANLRNAIADMPLGDAMTGLGHTRWATHGKKTERNAHPHQGKYTTVAHNGIIENYLELKEELTASGCVFNSETDSEVIPHLVDKYFAEGMEPIRAVQTAVKRLKGKFAFGVLFKGYDNLLVVARNGNPMILGFGSDGGSFGSDALALVGIAKTIVRIGNGETAIVTSNTWEIYDSAGKVISRPMKPMPVLTVSMEKDGYPHFMLKEIHQQPRAVANTFESMMNITTGRIELSHLPFDLANVSHFRIVGCGTSHHAALTAKYWMEALAGIPVDATVASELVDSDLPIIPGGAMIVISQSGETADSIAFLENVRPRHIPSIAIVNAAESSLAYITDEVINTCAWPEVSVASTKAYTTQLVVLLCLSIVAARSRGRISEEREEELLCMFRELPDQIQAVLDLSPEIIEIAKKLSSFEHAMFIGRGTSYPLALEGALKLKEVSYIHAEGHPAGELKHGVIATIDGNTPTIVLAPPGALFGKTMSALNEISSHDGAVILFSDEAGCDLVKKEALMSLALPTSDALVAPIIYTIALQLLAYHVAVEKGTDIDQPRNLAKSVTVE